MFDRFKILLKFNLAKLEWRIKNRHNFTQLLSLCDISKIDVGKGTYGGINAASFGCKESHLYIGNYCSIAQNVRWILDGEHYYTNLSTYPFKVRYFDEKVEAHCKGPIIVDDDVWIGERCLILSGVHISQGAIIGAGSVVSKDVPPYAIYAGSSVVKYRFNPDVIEKLLEFDFSKLDVNTVGKNLDLLYGGINPELLQSDFWKQHLKNSIQ